MASKCDNLAHKFKDAVDTADILGTPLKPEDMRNIVQQGTKAARSPMDYANSAVLNGMLSGLASTGFANVASMMIKMAHGYIDDITDSAIRKLRGRTADRYSIAEINAAYKAALMHMPIMWKMGVQGAKKGYPLDIDISLSQMAAGTGKSKKEVLDGLRAGLIRENVKRLVRDHGKDPAEAQRAAEAAFKTERDVMEAVQGHFNEHYDYMQNVWTDFGDEGLAGMLKYINVPTQLTVAIDEAGKSFFRMYDANKQLARKALSESARTKKPFSEVFNGYVEAMTKNKAGVKWSDMKGFDDKEYLDHFRQTIEKITGDSEAYEKSKEYALREMFQSQLTGVARTAHEAVNANASWGSRLLVPFMKTPWNIGKHAIAYTPAGIIIKKSKLGKPRLRKTSTGGEVIDDRYRGAYYDFTEDEMIARAAVGTMMMGTLAMLVDTDSITGAPRNAQEAQYMRDQGVPERSINIGGQWIPYGRIEPLATTFGLVADAKRLMQEYDERPKSQQDSEALEKALMGIGTAIKQNIMQKTFFEQFSTVLAGATEVQGSPVESAISGVLRSTIPTGVAQIARALDDKERQAGQGGTILSRMKERWMQRVPGLREQLPEEFGLYGARPEPTLTESFLSMKFVNEGDLAPAQKLAKDLNIEAIRPSADFKNLGITSEQVSQYRKLTSDLVRPELERLATNSRFTSLPEARQKAIAEQRIAKLRRQANKKFVRVLKQQDPTINDRLILMKLEKKGRAE